MAADEYREIIGKLGMSQEGAGEWLKIGKRTSQGYALGEYKVPGPMAILLRLLAAGKISVKDIEAAHDR